VIDVFHASAHDPYERSARDGANGDRGRVEGKVLGTTTERADTAAPSAGILLERIAL
jgi:hypothetical protein